MASTSSSPAPVMSPRPSNSNVPGHMTPVAINPLLLASVCCGSSAALDFLFSREDNQEPPMVIPSKKFLDLLTPSSRLTVPQVSGDVVEDGVAQPSWPATAPLLQGVTAAGGTAIHVIASHGDSTEFLKCVRIIHGRDQGLLFAVNRYGDTPLHCAARAGKWQMLTCLIEVAQSCHRSHGLLRMENGLKETALHDAVRTGKTNIVELLLQADSELANYPLGGISPLYLAVSLQKNHIAHTLHNMSHGNLSYHGPHGQNALHAATFQGTGITKDMLKWNNGLTTHGDKDGSTPLHFASSFSHSKGFKQLFKANPSLVYQADNNGSFPIHVAAAVGMKDTIAIILKKFPSSASLATSKGQTFLHVAVEKRRLGVISFACQTPSLAWILNIRDNDGNTALHLAVQDSKLRSFCSLYGNKEVHLSPANNNMQTPLDISRSLLPRGGYYNWNSAIKIYSILRLVGAKHSCLRWDNIEQKYSRKLQPEDTIKQAEKVKDLSQMLGIGSVLIATVAFGATFAVPGGYTDRGTPTLAPRYTFDAFMMANALAFICSSLAIIGLMYSGSSIVNLESRQLNLAASVFFMSNAVTSLSAAFALGVYMVLAPVAHPTAIVVCVISPLVVLFRNSEFLLKVYIIARSLHHRVGLFRSLNWLREQFVGRLFMELWPFMLIFGWAAIAKKLRDYYW